MLFCLMHDELVDQTYQGGAINALSQADVSIYDSNFTNNTASFTCFFFLLTLDDVIVVVVDANKEYTPL